MIIPIRIEIVIATRARRFIRDDVERIEALAEEGFYGCRHGDGVGGDRHTRNRRMRRHPAFMGASATFVRA